MRSATRPGSIRPRLGMPNRSAGTEVSRRTLAFINQEFEQIVFVVRDLTDIGPGQGQLNRAATFFFHDLAQRAPLGPAGIAAGERAAFKANVIIQNRSFPINPNRLGHRHPGP